MKINVCEVNSDNQSELILNDAIWQQKPHRQAMHQVVVATQAAQRQGSHMTKTRAMVSGGGRKPWKQKGTGRARHGSNRSPIWRAGGIVFGPTPERNYQLKVNKKVRRRAFSSALAVKAQQSQLTVLNELVWTEYNTKALAALLAPWTTPTTKTLIITATMNNKLTKSAANLAKVQVVQANSVDTLTIMRYQKIITTVDAISQLEKRCV